MDLSQYVVAVVFGICLCTGYVIKHSLDFIPNKYIPLIMFVLGTVINVIININDLSAEVFLVGMASGLASTGCHQLFKNLNSDEK